VRSSIGCTRFIHGSKSTGQFTRKIAAVPCFGIYLLKVAEMLGKGILDVIELLKPALGFLRLALDKNNGPRKLVSDLIAPALQLLLTSGQFLKSLFLFLDLILTLTQLEQFRLRSLYLILEFFCRGSLFEIQ